MVLESYDLNVRPLSLKSTLILDLVLISLDVLCG